jgi:subtilase family serine protease
MSSSDVARVGAAIRTVSRRLRRFAFRYDALEHRQLLSVGQSAATASAPLHNLVAQPAVAVTPLFTSSSPTGLSPSQVSNAYGLNQINFGSVTGNGAGQTIAIIDASYDPNIASDLQAFDSQYGLQSPGSFSQYVENGLWQINSGWALETALDVEWSHAMAPAANIVLVEAQPDLSDLFSAVSFASQLPGVSVVSMSWGASEFAGESAYDSVFTTPAGHNGVTFVAASGDSGTTEYPAASPNVLSVGGTTLTVTSQGNYVSETPWSNTGTGTSPYESQPTWQAAAAAAAGLSSSGRTTPDVSFNANPSTGVSVYDSIPYSGSGRTNWYTVGGTSVGAPSWAGLIAVADQGLALSGVGSLSNAQASLYQVSSAAFNHPSAAGTATTYALSTGLGTPKANLVVSALVQLNTPATTQATSSTPAKGTTVLAVAHGSDITATSSSPTTTNIISTSSSSSTLSITALTPTSASTSGTPTITPVVIVPPPTPPVLLHLSSSSSPVLAQMINSASALQAEQPPSLNMFGQALETELQKAFKPQLAPKSDAPALIDIVEPFQPLDPADAPKGEKALGPVGGWHTQGLSPFAVDAAIEASNGGLFPMASLDLLSRAKRRLGEKTWEFSTLFGAAAVAAGGFHLAMRESMRFKTRWLPGRVASSFPTGRWGGFRGR